MIKMVKKTKDLEVNTADEKSILIEVHKIQFRVTYSYAYAVFVHRKTCIYLQYTVRWS